MWIWSYSMYNIYSSNHLGARNKLQKLAHLFPILPHLINKYLILDQHDGGITYNCNTECKMSWKLLFFWPNLDLYKRIYIFLKGLIKCKFIWISRNISECSQNPMVHMFKIFKPRCAAEPRLLQIKMP